MFKRLIFLILVFLLIAYQYGIIIFLVSSTYFASVWAVGLLIAFVFILLFSDKLILFANKPVNYGQQSIISHLETAGRFLNLNSVRVFSISGDSIYVFRGLLGCRYICIGRKLTEGFEEQDLKQLISLSLIMSYKEYQRIDQTLYCLLYLLFLPATLLEKVMKHNFFSSILNWLYFPVQFYILESLGNEKAEKELEMAPVLGVSARDIDFLIKKFGLIEEDHSNILLTSKLVARTEMFQKGQPVLG